MGMPAGSKNAYYCPKCGGYTITIHRDDGVTPMFLACRATGDVKDCLGMAHSLMYPPEPWPQGVPTDPQFEWLKPNGRRIQHYQQGGLDLRRIA